MTSVKDPRAIYHIGIDDTDSSEGMCTTYLVYRLAQYLMSKTRVSEDTRLIDYPNLIRLNPNIPWKTRGNASLVLRIASNIPQDKLFKICVRFITRFATSDQANAGLVIACSERIPARVCEFSSRALWSVLSVKQAKQIISDFNFQSYALRSEQGLVGALAGIGNELRGDHTFELIAYRRDCSKPRHVEKSKIINMNKTTLPQTFNSYDEVNDRVLILPHGPDPVLLGIRGETSTAVKRAFQLLLPLKNLLGYMIFKSNQGTGEHLCRKLDLTNPKAFSSGNVLAKVSSKPRMHRGGHVFFQIENENGEISCACYEPTGKFRFHALNLAVGDEIEVGGGIRKGTTSHGKVLNVEYFVPKKLARIEYEFNPTCPECGHRLSSEGRGQGFECQRCHFRVVRIPKLRTKIPRKLEEDVRYLPDLKAHRHLTKPLQRYILVSKRKGRPADYEAETSELLFFSGFFSRLGSVENSLDIGLNRSVHC